MKTYPQEKLLFAAIEIYQKFDMFFTLASR